MPKSNVVLAHCVYNLNLIIIDSIILNPNEWYGLY